MTVNILLDRLKEFIEEQTKDIILTVRARIESGDKKERPAKVHIMKLPNKDSETKLIPYILLQFINGKDEQKDGESESECNIRIVVATYSDDGGIGAMDVLNLITRIRIALMKQVVIGEQFTLKMPLEYIVYPDDTAPYYLGEIMSIWNMPTIEREVKNLWH